MDFGRIRPVPNPHERRAARPDGMNAAGGLRLRDGQAERRATRTSRSGPRRTSSGGPSTAATTRPTSSACSFLKRLSEVQVKEPRIQDRKASPFCARPVEISTTFSITRVAVFHFITSRPWSMPCSATMSRSCSRSSDASRDRSTSSPSLASATGSSTAGARRWRRWLDCGCRAVARPAGVARRDVGDDAGFRIWERLVTDRPGLSMSSRKWERIPKTNLICALEQVMCGHSSRRSSAGIRKPRFQLPLFHDEEAILT